MSILSDKAMHDLWVTHGVSFDAIRAIEAAVLEAQGKQTTLWIQSNHLEKVQRGETFLCRISPEQIQPDFKPLFAAPVVQPDMVMVPREPTEAMLDAAMNRYQHVSPEAKARYTQMHRENFRCDYKAMIAAAEWKSNAEGKPTPD